MGLTHTVNQQIFDFAGSSRGMRRFARVANFRRQSVRARGGLSSIPAKTSTGENP
jgi:hypothetical protein